MLMLDGYTVPISVNQRGEADTRHEIGQFLEGARMPCLESFEGLLIVQNALRKLFSASMPDESAVDCIGTSSSS